MTAPIRVFLLDDHEIVRRGIADLLNAQDDIDVVGEAGSAASAVPRIRATTPDVALLDVRLPDGSGIDVCREVNNLDTPVRCVMLTAYDDEDALYSAVLAGAAGYVLKDIRGTRLIEAIRDVAAGRELISREVKGLVTRRLTARPAAPSGAEVLGLRERQILALIADGLTNRQIGVQLGLAEKTVKNYVSALLSKLGLERRTQAAVFAVEHRATAPAETTGPSALP